MNPHLLLFVLLFLTLVPSAAAQTTDYLKQRLHMVELIEDDVRDTSRYIGMSTFCPGVMTAMREVKRHQFVPQ